MTFGQRGIHASRWSSEFTIAAFLVFAIGTGTVHTGVVIALAVFLGGKPALVSQTSVSMILVATLEASNASPTLNLRLVRVRAQVSTHRGKACAP